MTTSLSPTTFEPVPAVLREGDPRLRLRCAPVESGGAALERDIADLTRSLADVRGRYGFGRALAAPQIGITRRLVVMDLGAGPFALVNPEITWRSERTFEVWDDCFSVPDRLVRVQRHASVSLSFRDARFRPRTWERLPEDLAELVQHELDHLDGVLMLDRAISSESIVPASRRAELMPPRPPRLPLASIAEAARSIDPVFLHTPQYECEPLSELLGCTLTSKVETLNPIRSFKGRGADWFVSESMRRGERDTLVCASAGNFGQALAYACRKHGLPLIVYAALGANPLKLQRIRALGAEVRLAGADFDAAKDAGRTAAADMGARFIEDGLQPDITCGAGTIGVELGARDDVYDAVVLPLGNGALLNGVARWMKARAPGTRIIGVCAEGATAMRDSWRNGPGGALVTHPRVRTIADGIAVRVPIAEAVDDMHGRVDDVLIVTDDALRAAASALETHAGLIAEPSGVAGLAAIASHRAAFEGQRVATVITGGNATSMENRS